MCLDVLTIHGWSLKESGVPAYGYHHTYLGAPALSLNGSLWIQSAAYEGKVTSNEWSHAVLHQTASEAVCGHFSQVWNSHVCCLMISTLLLGVHRGQRSIVLQKAAAAANM